MDKFLDADWCHFPMSVDHVDYSLRLLRFGFRSEGRGCGVQFSDGANPINSLREFRKFCGGAYEDTSPTVFFERWSCSSFGFSTSILWCAHRIGLRGAVTRRASEVFGISAALQALVPPFRVQTWICLIPINALTWRNLATSNAATRISLTWEKYIQVPLVKSIW